MSLDRNRVRQLLLTGDLESIFIEELGWDRYNSSLEIQAANALVRLHALAEKRGMIVYHCPTPSGENLPTYPERRRIEQQVTKTVHEHLIVFTDARNDTQVWQWVKREPGKPTACRDHVFHRSQPGDSLLQKLEAIVFSLDEEESLSLTDVTRRTSAAFNVERVTKRFYERFQKEHMAFLGHISGITDRADQEWYASVMLNRLMFVYFIQRKGFLDGDRDYLRNRLSQMRVRHGKDKFYSFYRYFLLRLFHEALGGKERSAELETLVGRIPYLNGGLFDVHELERSDRHGLSIQIPDQAFERIFDCFDQYQWHLDERSLRHDNEINPDVLGYIFEKYINQKQMGAYYTKEDITEYISKNTILPFIFDDARSACKVAFEDPEGPTVWDLLRNNPDRYIYPAVQHGTALPLQHVVAMGLDPLTLRESVGAGAVETLELRKGWNKLATSEYGLPTETWREVVVRRERYEEIKAKLAAGEVREINELISLNLDIRQFAQDVIENCEHPELLRALWHAIETITVLDPTCGSGAFLFAAANILEPLYEACLDRMESFAEQGESSGWKDQPEQMTDFRNVLKSVAAHPNRRYFIYKSIILNNLFGVDIMGEATEICKLRLFLKLAAQVDPDSSHDNLGIDPLPDIDFNIRTGNTLVGFATYRAVENAVKRKFDFGNAMETIAAKAADLQQLFDAFRARQVEGDGSAPTEDKQQLHRCLAELEYELNHYLATEYDVDPSDETAYLQWERSHQPFHWFVEFYGIMKGGGFDVIIGNPPYVESKNVSNYKLRDYATNSCGDLYAFTLERTMSLSAHGSWSGFIVPLSCFSVKRFLPLQQLYRNNALPLFISSWSGDAHPSKLFEGVNKRLSIVLSRQDVSKYEEIIYSSKYLKWYAEERSYLFNLSPAYRSISSLKNVSFFDASVPKICTDLELSILAKLRNCKTHLGSLISRAGEYQIYYTRKVSFFLQFLDFVPEIRGDQGELRTPSELKVLAFNNEQLRDLGLGCLSTSLFYWYNLINSDCRNLNKREIVSFPVPNTLPTNTQQVLNQLLATLMISYRENSSLRTVTYKGKGKVTVQYFNFRASKPIVDEIDRLMAQHYGFTEEELDFIINYDIKYRMGMSANCNEK